MLQHEVKRLCVNLIGRLRTEFGRQCSMRIDRLMEALEKRPIIYTGGGSTFSKLRTPYIGFKDIIHISEREWRVKAINEIVTIKALDLCPILSTAYGLSISVANDDIQCEPFSDVFKSVRGYKEEKNNDRKYVFGSAISSSGFNYNDDYDALK